MLATPVITLISDWGQKDVYIALVKATIYNSMPHVPCVDISHDIAPFNVNQTAYLLAQIWHLYPKGSVHIIGVDTEASLQNPHVVVAYHGHFFIGADNGIFDLLFPDTDMQAYEIDMYQKSNKYTFSVRDVFVPVAVGLMQGKSLEHFGQPYLQLKKRRAFQPVIDEKSIKTKVIYTDAYHNVVCNLTEALFKQYTRRRKYRIILNADSVLHTISSAYGDVKEGMPLALFNTAGFLEIAVNKGKAAGLLGLQVNDIVHIDLL